MALAKLSIRNFTTDYPIWQGGMGIGFSGFRLAGTVSLYGGLGIVSSAGLDRVTGQRKGIKLNARNACCIEIQDAKIISDNRPVGINIMVAAQSQYEDSVLGAMDGGVDAIISGAGLPLKLPEIASRHDRYDQVALVPIVSSKRALQIIIRKWEKFNRLPDAVVVEGPLAGGHIGWSKVEETEYDENKLEFLVQDIVSLTREFNIPLIAAGGIHNQIDILHFLELGANGVQMGTRFLATFESGASEEYKQKIIDSKKSDILLADNPGSPCGLLFRVLKTSPFYQEAVHKLRPPKCNKGYILVNGECSAKSGNGPFCICNGLLSSCGLEENEKELYTVGARAHEIDRIISVADLMQELTSFNNKYLVV